MTTFAPLDGPWRFCPDPQEDGVREGWFAAEYDDSLWSEGELPGVFDRLQPSLAGYEGPVWFRKCVRSETAPDRLCGEGASYVTTAWVNGMPVGENPDPFLTFVFPLGRLWRADGENVIVLRVDNTRRPGDVPGPQRGWRPFGGVLRTLRLERAPGIESAGIDARADGTFRIEARLAGERETTLSVHLRPDGEDGPTWTGSVTGSGTLALSGRLDDPPLWSPETPRLYEAILDPGQPAMQRRIRFGFRTIAVENERIHLNGAPIFLRGFNRHEDSPARDMATDRAQALADLSAMKNAGANFVRLCHYPHDPSTLDLCDELGLLAMAEIPLYWWGDQDEDHAAKLENARRQLTKLIARDKNHPSVILWSVSNETSDGDETVASGNRELVRLAKALDPSRLAAHVSDKWRSHPNFDEDDVICINAYPTWFPGDDGAPAFQWRDELARLHEGWPKPIVVTEFGHPGIAGAHAGRLSEEFQAEAIAGQFDDMTRSPTLCGAVVWCWADHPWPDNAWVRGLNVSPFGVVGRDRMPKPARETLAKRFAAFSSSPQLRMRRKTLADLPPLPPPPDGYRLRTATRDDAPRLALTLDAAFPEIGWSVDDTFTRLFNDASVATTYVVEHEASGAIAASASVRLVPEQFPDAGYLHWVGGDPQHRGKRLGWLVTLAVLHEFRARGCTYTLLETDDFRVPAIRVYRQLGYEPLLNHASHAERWARLTAAIG